MENQYRVSAISHVTAVAGAIAKSIRDGNSVVLQAIGAGAVNQAVKAIAIARGYLAGDQLDIVCAPSFVELNIDGAERTAVRLHIDRPGRALPFVPAIAPKVRPEL
jgi:stage V sporulation protein S